jgi:hypothetical protein
MAKKQKKKAQIQSIGERRDAKCRVISKITNVKSKSANFFA